MTDDYVIDTNVWVKAEEIEPATEIDVQCALHCLEWLGTFVDSPDRLVLDDRYLILGEYRRNIMRGGLAEQWLNQLETKPRDIRLVELPITIDRDGNAEVPSTFAVLDPSDRKFVAVALAHKPTPPIINATDTDWSKVGQELEAAGIILQEHCPVYIEDKLQK